MERRKRSMDQKYYFQSWHCDSELPLGSHARLCRLGTPRSEFISLHDFATWNLKASFWLDSTSIYLLDFNTRTEMVSGKSCTSSWVLFCRHLHLPLSGPELGLLRLLCQWPALGMAVAARSSNLKVDGSSSLWTALSLRPPQWHVFYGYLNVHALMHHGLPASGAYSEWKSSILYHFNQFVGTSRKFHPLESGRDKPPITFTSTRLGTGDGHKMVQ